MKERNRNVYEGFMEKYPILFQDRTKPITQSCMCWGIDCPEGWLDILTNLCNKLELLNNTVCKENKVKIVATQVKEKFGTLRFYFDLTPFWEEETDENTYNLIYDMVSDLINYAEHKTSNVCQVCGKPFWYEKDKKVSKGWIGYYCEKCATEYDVDVFENDEETEDE